MGGEGEGSHDGRNVRRNGGRGVVDLPLRALARPAKWLLGITGLVMALDTFIFGDAMLGSGGRLGRRLSSTCEIAGHGEAIEHSLYSMLCAVLCAFVLCVFLDHMNYLLPSAVRFPISCIIFLIGVGLHFAMKYLMEAGEGKETGFAVFLSGRLSFAHLDPHAIFFVILPPLLYESSSAMQWHVLRKVLPSSILLAGPGVIVNLLLTAVICKKVLISSNGFEFNWSQILLLSTLLSATDPVAVVAALRTLGAPAKLSGIIDGESLLNDGSAFVVFMVFQDLAGADAPDEEKMCPGESPGVGCVIGKFVQLAVGGCAIGFVAGLLMSWWIKHARFVRGLPLELAIILVGVYGSFFLAETLQCSGVLAEVILGMTMSAKGLSSLSPEARHEHHVVIGIIAYLCDKIIFFAAGFISARFISDTVVCDEHSAIANMVGGLFFLYFILHVVRAIVVAIFAPVLRRQGYGLTFKEGCLVTFAGLRGALGLAMGLFVEHNSYIGVDAQRSIAFYTSGVVFLTLVINGATVDEVYKRLRLYQPNKYRVRHLTKQLQKVEMECQHKGLRKMQRHWFFSDCNFEAIYPCVPNFANVSFSECSLTPVPTGIAPVYKVLAALEAHCYTARKRRRDFIYVPDEHRAETTQNVTSWLTEAVNIASKSKSGGGDILVNVIDVEDGALEYRRLEGKSVAFGCYASRRPLAEILGRSPDVASFWVSLANVGRERIVVGLVSSLPITEDFQTMEATGQIGLLGVGCGTIGLDTSTCDIWYNDGAGPMMLQDTWEALAPLEVHRWCSLTSQVIGKKTFGEIFTGYKVGNWIWLAGNAGFISVGNAETDFADLGQENAGSNTFLVKARETSRPRRALAADSEIIVRVSRHSGQPWHVSFYIGKAFGKSHTHKEPELVGTVSLGELSPGDLFPVVEFRSPAPVAKRSFSMAAAMQASQHSGKVEIGSPKVRLSFQPEVVDVDFKESLNEVFTTLFNTVLHHYNERQEHGIIGTTAYEWLVSSASEAVDCANREVHAKSVLDFRCVDRTKELVEASEGSGVMCHLTQNSVSTATVGRNKKRASNPFEPLMVEYLFLKDRCTSEMWWEKLPIMGRTFSHRMRAWGNETLNNKMECLYAFIDCHEHVLEDFSTIERFPAMRYCVECVLNAAKQDLWMLQDLSPRRFFYSRHTLLLKIVISTRMRKLVEDAEAGWLSAADADPLIHLTADLLAKIGLHTPLVQEEEEPSSEGRNPWRDTFAPERPAEVAVDYESERHLSETGHDAPTELVI